MYDAERLQREAMSLMAPIREIVEEIASRYGEGVLELFDAAIAEIEKPGGYRRHFFGRKP